MTARLYDEDRKWGLTMREKSIEIDNETGAIGDISYDFRWWRWSQTDSPGSDEIYVFVPRVGSI